MYQFRKHNLSKLVEWKNTIKQEQLKHRTLKINVFEWRRKPKHFPMLLKHLPC